MTTASLTHWFWRHFTRQGRHFWHDLYFETLGFYDASRSRCECKSQIIQRLRAQLDEAHGMASTPAASTWPRIGR